MTEQETLVCVCQRHHCIGSAKAELVDVKYRLGFSSPEPQKSSRFGQWKALRACNI